MKRKIQLLLLILTTTLSAFAQLEANYGTVSNNYNYWLYTPPTDSIEYEGPKPLIVFLHGKSLCGSDLNKVRRYGTINAVEKGRDLDAFVLAPQNPGTFWDPQKLITLVDYIIDNNDVDPNRVYVLGMSLGGYGTLDFAAAFPDRIAAAVAMCGGATKKNLDGLADMPLWIIHGTGDSAVSVSKSDRVADAVKAAQNDGENRLSYDRIPGMNHSEPARFLSHPGTYEWLMSHSLLDPGRPMTPTPKIDEDFRKSCYQGLRSSKK